LSDSDEPRSDAEPALEADEPALEADVARLSAKDGAAATQSSAKRVEPIETDFMPWFLVDFGGLQGFLQEGE